jgi:pimeloyl-ACP methyl ester carboxylesterase
MAGIPMRREVEMSRRVLWLSLLLALPLAAGAGDTGKQLSLPVSFETSDGFVLKGDLTAAADVNAPVAILLHMYRSDRSAWAPLVPDLLAAGFTVLAIDQRAHGESAEEVAGVRALVLLSPGTNYFGVDVVEAASSFPGPLLVVAAADDRNAVESARTIAARHRGTDDLEIYRSGGHGTRLFGPRRPRASRSTAPGWRPTG